MKIQAIVIAAGVALGLKYAIADPLPRHAAGVLPPAKINGTVRAMGLMPAGQPIRQGDTYAVLATSRRGKSVRIIVDARFGEVLSVQQVIGTEPAAADPKPTGSTSALPSFPPVQSFE